MAVFSIEVHSLFDEIRPDAILNFAAESHVDRSNEDDLCFWKSNVLGVRNLALEAAVLGIRLVHVSTDEVYGDAKASDKPWTESSPVVPKNPYAVTKASAEMLLGVYCESSKHNLDVVITRGANTIGPRQFPEKAVPKAIFCFTNGRPFPLFRTPARRMWMYVEDHAAGIEAALKYGKRGEVYNLAPESASEAQTEEVIERVRTLVAKLAGTEGEIEKVDDRANYDLRYWMSASKAVKELGWRPKNDLEATIKKTVEWYLGNQVWLIAANRKLTAAPLSPHAILAPTAFQEQWRELYVFAQKSKGVPVQLDLLTNPVNETGEVLDTHAKDAISQKRVGGFFVRFLPWRKIRDKMFESSEVPRLGEPMGSDRSSKFTFDEIEPRNRLISLVLNKTRWNLLVNDTG